MNEEKEPDKKLRKWSHLRSTAGFRNALTFLVFVAIAAAFWFIVSLNDSVQDSFKVDVNIYNLPDSVTFIVEPPKDIHVTVRDRGTLLLRQGVLHNPEISINFREFASQGSFRFTSADLYAALRATFGSNAQFTSVSVDSLCYRYTTSPGKRVPIVIDANVTAEPGKVVAGDLVAQQKYVLLYSSHDNLDTINRVSTRRIVRRDLNQTTTVDVPLAPIPGVRIVPPSVQVTIPVEALVNKHSRLAVTPVNVPTGSRVLLFPSQVEVNYYLPMSRFDEETPDLDVEADFSAVSPSTQRVPLRVGRHSGVYTNVTLLTDSVEYTLVK